MKQQVVYNLEEFATKYHLNDIFGAYAAHFSIGAAYSSIIEIDATAPLPIPTSMPWCKSALSSPSSSW